VVGISAVLELALALVTHPLHTSFAQVTFDTRARTVEVSLRVFVDDYTSAAESWARGGNSRANSPLVGYAVASFVLRESNGHTVALRSCGGKRVGDLMWLCLRGQLSTTPRNSSVISRVLFEKFEDQVNVVQTAYDGRKANLLFTSDDTEKRIP
jgi:hypothetical protein